MANCVLRLVWDPVWQKYVGALCTPWQLLVPITTASTVQLLGG